MVVQRQGERPVRDAPCPERPRPSPSARRLRIRQPAHPQQREEGGPPGRRAAVHPARQGARHPDPRHVRPRASRRDARDDRGDDPLRLRARSGHDPGVDRRALPWHADAPPGPRAGLARRPRARRRAGRSAERAELPAPRPYRDLRLRGDVLPTLLFPTAEALRDCGRDGAGPAGGRAAAPGGGRRRPPAWRAAGRRKSEGGAAAPPPPPPPTEGAGGGPPPRGGAHKKKNLAPPGGGRRAPPPPPPPPAAAAPGGGAGVS